MWRLISALALVAATTMANPAVALRVSAQNDGESAGLQQLIVLEPTTAYSNDGDVVGEASSGDVYAVLAVDEGAALVVGTAEDSEPFWIELDARVELVPVAPPPVAAPDALQVVPPSTPAPQPTTGAATPTVTAGPAVAPTAVLVAPPPAPANTPSAWSLTVNDLPAGFTIETTDASEDADGIYYTALFNRRGTSTERGPYGVFNQLALLKFPSGIRLGQEFVDRIGDELEFTTTYELGASTITSDIRTSASTRVNGPALGDLSRWHRATVTQSIGGVTVTTELHLVIFTLGNRVAVVGTMNVEGAASQADALSLANIVQGRMQS